jgi:2-polyprenyl-6-methoxyphenol hydroxylase-like FAD-dependent oxidoreductase
LAKLQAEEILMFDTDVLIVGAGPTGLTLAAALLANGIGVAIVDRQAEGANTSRAGVINARSLEVLEGLDVTRRLVKEGIQAPLFTIRDGKRVLISIDFSGLPTAYPYSLMLPQNDTERILLARVVELGGEVLRPKVLTSVTQDADGAIATFADGDTLHASYVVGADGMHSTVREQTDITFEGDSYEESFVLADVHMTGDTPTAEVILVWAKAGLTVIAPLPDGSFRIVAPLQDAPEEPSPALIQQLIDDRTDHLGDMTVTDVVWGSRFRVHHRVADAYRSGRILLAGDAAHVHSPAGGQGMNLGIQDAVALADALTTVLRGGPDTAFNDRALDVYAETRRPIAQGVISLTDKLTRLATAPTAVRPIRNTFIGLVGRIPAVQRTLAARLSGLVYR